MDILKDLKKEQMYIINLIKEVCLKLNIKAYLVGGAVRDTILNRNIRDIDICVECNPIIIIEKLDYIETYKYHEKFETSTIVFKNNIEVDLIRCRKERYDYPGALPRITPSDIQDDLYRRDFTVNAIAYDIIHKNIVDPFNGYCQIEEKKIKKVHSNSYKEDPTRIFRAIKYAGRYGFNISNVDYKEIENELKNKALINISNDRIIREIISICNENNWIDNVKMLHNFGIFNVKISVLQKKSDFLHNNLEDRLLRLFLSLRINSERDIFINNSILNKQLRKAFKDYEKLKGKLDETLANNMDNFSIYSQLKKLNLYQLTLLGFNDLYKYKVLNYINNLQQVKVGIKGEYLLKKGIEKGKVCSGVLNHLLRLKLNTGILEEKKYLDNKLGEILDVVKYKN